MMARTLGVSRSGFHAWSQRISSSRRHDARESLDQSVRTVFYAHKSRYGAPSVAKELHEMGTPCDRKTVASSLRRQGLRARAARKYKATTNSEHSLPVAPNVLKQDFSASAPNQNGYPILRIYRPMKAGCIWPRLSLCTRVKSLAGRWTNACMHDWCAMRLRWPYGGANALRASSSTVTVEASTARVPINDSLLAMNCGAP